MKHQFYQKSRREQNRIQLIIGLCAFVLNLGILILSILSGIYFLICLSVAITLSIIAPFFDTPTLKKKGHLTYYSPFLIAEKEKNGEVIIHGGTLFDYVYVIDWQLNGQQRKNLILLGYLKGLLTLIEKYEESEAIGTRSVKVKGTSYILNKRTIKRIGFKEVNTDFLQTIILVYNYVNLTLAHSIAKAKVSFPNLNNIMTYEADLTSLVNKKEYILQLKENLENNKRNKSCNMKGYTVGK